MLTLKKKKKEKSGVIYKCYIYITNSDEFKILNIYSLIFLK